MPPPPTRRPHGWEPIDDRIGRASTCRASEGKEPSETQADIPEDQYDKLITGQVSADA